MRRTGSLSVLVFALALTLGFAAWSSPAQAGFHVCNKTNLTTRLALGHFDGTHWSSEGWWTIKPENCVSVLTGALNARYYYLYATDQKAGTWEGSTHFCVAPEKRFQAVGRADCVKRGFARRGFFEVDTGDKPDWTQNLSN